MKKTYILDTNVLLNDADAVNAFCDNDVIIPMCVLEELDKFKSRQDEVGRHARHVNRLLDDMRSTGNLKNGVDLRGGGKLSIISCEKEWIDELPLEYRDIQKVDNIIIAISNHLSKNSNEPIILVSKDVNMRVKCDFINVESQDYLHMRVMPGEAGFYSGVKTVNVSNECVDDIYDTNSHFNLLDWDTGVLYPNQIVILKSENRSIITRFIADKDGEHTQGDLRVISNPSTTFGLRPKNKEQTFALDLLLDDNVKLVTLCGIPGGGKSLLALAAGLDQLHTLGSYKRYEKMIISRPVQPLGNDLGFLPGSLQEKLDPWLAPIKDNLNFLFGKKTTKDPKKKDEPYFALQMENGNIEVEAITYIRGRSIPRSYLLIDEAQNITMHELKTIITRVGEGTKIVLTGDIEQIDNPRLDVFTNGLTCAIEKFKNYTIAGHVTLQKGERSELASLASKIL